MKLQGCQRLNDSPKVVHCSTHSIEDSKYPDNIPLTMEDMINLPNHIEQFTDILEVVNKEKGKKKIIIGTRVNGYTIIVNLVSDGRNAVRPLTIYKMNTESYLKRYGNKIKKKKVDVDAQAQKLEIGSNRTPSVVNSSSDKNIPYNNKNVKFTLSDNQGRQLTKEQQQYFKDSKVRDENGSLLTVYHGTDSEFTVFDRGKIGKNYWQSGNSAFGGFYFTDNKSTAENYATLSTGLTAKGRVVESYLNITNPLISETGRDAFEFFDDHSIELLQEAVIAENDGIIIKGEETVKVFL